MVRETYLRFPQISRMESFATIVNTLHLLTMTTNSGPGYSYFMNSDLELNKNISLIRNFGAFHLINLTFSCLISKNGPTYFKNLVLFTPQDFQSMFGHFSKLYIKGLTVLLFFRQQLVLTETLSNFLNNESFIHAELKAS